MASPQNALEYFSQALDNEAERLPLDQWAARHINTKEGKISFQEHPEQLKIYQDMHPRQVYLKGVQVGMSTHLVSRAFWLSDDRLAKVMYLLPTRSFVNEFVADRVDGIIDSSMYIKDRMREVDNRYVKKFGFSTLYFHGCESEGDVVSADIDFLIGDEIDIMNQANLKVAEDRLEHSRLGWLYFLSKPSVPGFGIDEKFKNSDQHYYLFRCQKCRHDTNVIRFLERDIESALRFEKKKGGNCYYFACEKCGNPLDPVNGHWVATNPDSDIRGYHLSQAYWVRQPALYSNVAEKFYKKYREIKNSDDKKYFWRSLVGIAWGGDEQPLTDEILNEKAGDYNLSPTWPGICFAGIDNSDIKHLTIGHVEGFKLVFHFFGEFDSIEEIYKYFTTNNIKKCGIDALPNKDTAKKLALKFKKRVFIQYFKQNQKEGEELAKLEKVEVLQVNRTDSLGDLIDGLKTGVLVIPGEKAGTVMKEVRKHLKMLIKEKVTNSDGITEYKYKTNVPNHYAMAMNSANQAWMLFQLNMPTVISTVPVGGHISVGGSRYDSTH